MFIGELHFDGLRKYEAFQFFRYCRSFESEVKKSNVYSPRILALNIRKNPKWYRHYCVEKNAVTLVNATNQSE